MTNSSAIMVMTVVPLFCLILLPAAYGFVEQEGPLIFIADRTSTRTFWSSQQHCEHLGGRLAGDFTPSDEAFLTRVRANMKTAFWVNAEPLCNGAYCWSGSRERLDYHMWCPGEPDCYYESCAVAYGSISAYLGLLADDASNHRNALCSFDTRVAKQIEVLKRQAAGELPIADHTVLAHLSLRLLSDRH